MAEDPNRPLGDRDKVERDVNARVGYGWIWIWVAIIIILVIWFGGFGWGGYGGWWWSNRPHTAVVGPNPANGQNAGLATNGQPAPAGSPAVATGSGVQILAATNKQTYINQPFVISNIPVQKVVNDHAFWIGANGSTTMLVVLTGNQNNAQSANLQQGSRVSVSGQVEPAPSSENAKRMWSLSDDGVKRLEQQGAFVQATQVQVGQNQNGQNQAGENQTGQP